MKRILLAAFAVIAFASVAYAGTGQHEIVNPEVEGATAISDLPSTCYLEADDVDNMRSIYTSCDPLDYLDLADPGSGYAETSKALVLDDSGDVTFTSGTQTLYDVTVSNDLSVTGEATVTDTINLSSGVLLSATADLDIDNLMAGTLFYHSGSGELWYCSSTGGCGAVYHELD